jgi:hypothetical protein
MATVTPIYNWPVPTSTDYVKDGATAIESLGDAIDSSLNSITGGKNVGLVLLNSTAVSAQSRVTFSNVFTSDYEVYKVEFDVTGSTDSIALLFQVAASGTQVVGTAYSYTQMYQTNIGGDPQGYGEASIGNALIGSCKTVGQLASATICDIAKAEATKINVHSTSWGASTSQQDLVYGVHRTATAYDGMSISTSSGTFTGTIRIYGLRNS